MAFPFWSVHKKETLPARGHQQNAITAKIGFKSAKKPI
jgi:hypothetical protein